MHHFIFPSKDTFITNRPTLDDKNFGIDEILQIGTTNKAVRTLSPTKNYIYSDIVFNNQSVQLFTGIFTGSFGGTVVYSSGSMSGSNLIFTASYYSGSINNVSSTGSGGVSGSLINVFISGSVTAPYVSGLFTGHLTDAIGCFTGTGSGVDVRNEQNWTTAATLYVDRSLLAFDLTAISKSIVNGDIVNPQFTLNVKVCNEYDLPITYTIYALPANQNWNMGDGYLSDGGSDTGTSWQYLDNNLGTQWYNPYITTPRPSIDFINNLSYATTSFGYGGGTWVTTSYCSQSFRYKSADIDMDITPIVMFWLNGNIINQGIILVHSDELQSTGSGFVLKYFSRDTNTIYSPYLDVAWNDSIIVTGSITTGSSQTTTIIAGITSSIQSGSSFTIANGVSGSFSSSTFLTITSNYITASNQIFNYSAPNPTANNVWYANNGYHYDSWQTAWQLDPNHGGFLPNTDIQQTSVPDYGTPPIREYNGNFTGSFSGTASYFSGSISGSGEFSSSYFSGSIDYVNQEIIGGNVSGSLISGSIVGTIMSLNQVGLFEGLLTSPLIYLNGTGSGTYLDTTFLAFSGVVNGTGLSGNILGIPVLGNAIGLVTISQSLITGSCGTAYSASLAKAIFTNGIFSGSSFTAYYIDYQFKNAFLTGSWNVASLLGSTVIIPIPSGIDPYAYAYVNGTYVNGTAMGIYVVSGSNEINFTSSAGANSASFSGQFINGNLLGGYLYLQLSGSIYTSSYSYTSSVFMTSNVMTPLNVQKPFTINVQNLQPQYRSGDIIKIDLFGRKKFPLKYFGLSTQQEQYMVPEFLPTASYYALRDNQTNEIVVPFDSYTQISCDYPNGNFFIVDTTGLAQERYYRVLIQVNDANETYTIDTGKTFKITR
jgi:hypothetical protein